MDYRKCFVPSCNNDNDNSPNKIFVRIREDLREKWCQEVKTEYYKDYTMYCCEDHLDPREDLTNYYQCKLIKQEPRLKRTATLRNITQDTKGELAKLLLQQPSTSNPHKRKYEDMTMQTTSSCSKLPTKLPNDMHYHLMGSISKDLMKPGCMPHKFTCQSDTKSRISGTTEPYAAKKQRMMIIEECEKEFEVKYMDAKLSSIEEVSNIVTSSSVQQNVEVSQITPDNHSAKELTSLLKPIQDSVSTSVSKMKHHEFSSEPSLSVYYLNEIGEKIEQSDSDNSDTDSVTHSESSSSVISLQMESTSDSSEMIENTQEENLKALECTLKKINKSPHTYIGIPSNCYFIVDMISKHTNIPFNHILLCLKKIRLNSSFHELADDFGIERSNARKIFFQNVPIIASVLSPFIVSLDNESTKKNLPIAFRHKYFNVSCIMDCLEVEVQKPSKALDHALSWSNNKNANTIKYLISCTPNGLINYVSNGYGGRITDTSIVETIDLSQCLQPNMLVMTDRGFQHVELYLQKMAVQLVRPPSVVSGDKLTKTEAKQTKQIGCLRSHVEQVIRRLREFNMLKPHACLNLSLVKVLDDVVTIACGLINLQDSLI